MPLLRKANSRYFQLLLCQFRAVVQQHHDACIDMTNMSPPVSVTIGSDDDLLFCLDAALKAV